MSRSQRAPTAAPRVGLRSRALLLAGALALIVAGLSGSRGESSPLRLLTLAVGIAAGVVVFAPLWLVRISLAVGGLALIGGALAELGLQYFGDPVLPTLCVADPVCLYRLRPGASRTHQVHRLDGGAEVEIRINQSGFRGEPLLPRGAARRVLVYGDSFIEADAVPLEQTFVERLEGYLAADLGVDVECINAGVNGYGPDQSLARMEAELEALAPELVVLSIFAGNDFGDLVRNRLVSVNAAGELGASEFHLGRDALDQLEGQAVLRLPRLLRKGLERLPELLHEVESGGSLDAEARWRARWEPQLAQQRRDFERSVVDDDPTVVNLLHDYYDLDLALEPDGPSAAHKRRLMTAVLAAFAQTCREQDVQLVVLAVPSSIDVCESWGFSQLAAQLYPAYQRTAATDSVAAATQAAAVPLVDLFPAFDESGADALFFRFDDHWNGAGQDLAASLVAQEIVEQGLL